MGLQGLSVKQLSELNYLHLNPGPPAFFELNRKRSYKTGALVQTFDLTNQTELQAH